MRCFAGWMIATFKLNAPRGCRRSTARDYHCRRRAGISTAASSFWRPPHFREVYEDSKTEYDLATNSLERAQSALRLVDDHISKTKILAPFDCTVLTRPVSLGQTVSGAAGFNSGTEVMTIANLNDMIINAHINQADVTRLTTGETVDIQVESVPGLKMKGSGSDCAASGH